MHVAGFYIALTCHPFFDTIYCDLRVCAYKSRDRRTSTLKGILKRILLYVLVMHELFVEYKISSICTNRGRDVFSESDDVAMRPR